MAAKKATPGKAGKVPAAKQNETPAAEGAATAEAPKKEKVEYLRANGITRPKAGTATARVWEIADELSKAAGAPAKRSEVLEKFEAEGGNASTGATQYGKWRRFYGLGREDRTKEEAPAAAAAE